MERRRSSIGFALDKRHDFDLAFWRHYGAVEEAVRKFDPDVVHITGPSDVGQLGALVAHRLQVPLAASWHTNLHQYAERRALKLLHCFPQSWKIKMGGAIQAASLRAILRFYRIARILFAPTEELISLLEKGTGKACYPMQRGVDTQLFDPVRRNRQDTTLVLGYVGRLSPEKNVRFLADIEKALPNAGLPDFRFLVVGQGSEGDWLKANLRQAEFAGLLRGEDLARAYANMDLFVFPSLTDTYGNVVLEALASGVPAIVTDSGGPQSIVRPEETGYVARNLDEFVRFIKLIADQPAKLAAMRTQARDYAKGRSWDKVFESVYSSYERAFTAPYAGKRSRLGRRVQQTAESLT